MKRKVSILLVAIMMLSVLAACSPKNTGGAGKDVDLKEIHAKIKEELGEDYLPSMELSLEDLENLTGVGEDEVDEFIAETPMISAHVDTFIAIKAKDDKADGVEEDLEKYRDYLNEESINYPMNLAKVKAAKVVRHGNYIFFIMLGKFDDSEDSESAEALAFAEAEVKKVEDIIDGFFK